MGDCSYKILPLNIVLFLCRGRRKKAHQITNFIHSWRVLKWRLQPLSTKQPRQMCPFSNSSDSVYLLSPVGGQSEVLRPWQRSWGRRLDIRKGGIEPPAGDQLSPARKCMVRPKQGIKKRELAFTWCVLGASAGHTQEERHLSMLSLPLINKIILSLPYYNLLILFN